MRIFSIITMALVLTLSLSFSVNARGNYAKQNHPAYWGDNCVKFEHFNDRTYSYTSTADDVEKVIVKGGPDRVVYTNDFKDLHAPLNEKNNKHYAISHVIECYDNDVDEHDDDDEHEEHDDDDHQDEPKDDNEKPKKDNDDHRQWICHWTNGVRGYILIKPAKAGVENGHLGEHHHHDKDVLANEHNECPTVEQEEPKDCDDQVYYQHNKDVCDPEDPTDPEEPDEPEQPEEPEEPEQPQDDPEEDPDVLGDTTPVGKGGGELPNTGSSLGLPLGLTALVFGAAIVSAKMSLPSKEEQLSAIAL